MKPLALFIGNNALDAPLPTCWFVPCVFRNNRSRCAAAKGGGAKARRRPRAARPRFGGGKGRGGRGSAAAEGGGAEVRRRQRAEVQSLHAEPGAEVQRCRACTQNQVQTRRGAEPALRTRCKGAEVQSVHSEPSAEVQRCRACAQNQVQGLMPQQAGSLPLLRNVSESRRRHRRNGR